MTKAQCTQEMPVIISAQWFAGTRETIKFHEDVLVFYKWDPRNIQETFWEVEMEDMGAMLEAEAADDEDESLPQSENL